MRKIIKKYGDSFIIRLSPEDMKANKLKEGDIVDMEIKKSDKFFE
jgi:hypothetical protein